MRAVAATIAIALLLTGCAAQDPYPAATSDSLQEKVLEISTLAADGNPADALTRLGELTESTETAHNDGDLTDDRYAAITAAIDDVSTDLTDQVTAAEKAAAEETAQQETVTDEPVADDPVEETETDPALENAEDPGKKEKKDKKDKKNENKGPKG